MVKSSRLLSVKKLSGSVAWMTFMVVEEFLRRVEEI